MWVRLGQWAIGHRSMAGTPECFNGKVAYIHPTGRWLTIQGDLYRESFMMGDVERRRSGKGKTK